MTDITLDIESLSPAGEGAARLPDGTPALIPLTLPGERVRARIDANPGHPRRGALMGVERASEARADPPCPHFGACGGCALQHMTGDSYRAFKRERVLAHLKKAHVAAPENIDTLFIPPGTRRRANFAARIGRGVATIGFHGRKSSTIHAIPGCLLLTPQVEQAMRAAAMYLPRLAGEGEKIDVLIQSVSGDLEIGLTGRVGEGRLSLAVQEGFAAILNDLNLARVSVRARDYAVYRTVLEARPLFKRSGALSVRLPPGAFLQPSEEGEAALSALIVASAAQSRVVADLFCGSGTFTGPLIAAGKTVSIAADADEAAIAALAQTGVPAMARNLFKHPLSPAELASVDTVILDPPRAGAWQQMQGIVQSGVKRVIHVSCNPETFARDSAALIHGGYVFTRLHIVDQFTWSPHVEQVGVFERRC